jgi:hypothetical protein
VQRHIVPQLRPYPQPHSVVVMDRASIHFRPDIIELIERRGARVFACAPHCPWVGLHPLSHSGVTRITQDYCTRRWYCRLQFRQQTTALGFRVQGLGFLIFCI